MAKILIGVVGQLSGSIGNQTYAHNRYGAYVRAKSTPVNPQSTRQSAVRNIFAQLTQAWQTVLSAEQRTAWEAYGANVACTDRLGNTIYLSGLNHYVRSNVAILSAGLTRVDDGPTTYALPDTDPTFAVAADQSTGKLTVTFDDTADWCDIDGAAMVVHAGRAVAPSINFYKSPFRSAGAILGASVSPPTSGSTLTAPYTISTGNKIFAFARIVLADGRLSNPFRVSVTAT